MKTIYVYFEKKLLFVLSRAREPVAGDILDHGSGKYQVNHVEGYQGNPRMFAAYVVRYAETEVIRVGDRICTHADAVWDSHPEINLGNRVMLVAKIDGDGKVFWCVFPRVFGEILPHEFGVKVPLKRSAFEVVK